MMTKAEVEAVVKRLFKETKGGISQTKDSLMIGLTPYRCLGCSDIFTGMNAMNASKVSWVGCIDVVLAQCALFSEMKSKSKMNHDVFPTRSLKPLQSLWRPRSAIGRLSSLSPSVSRYGSKDNRRPV